MQKKQKTSSRRARPPHAHAVEPGDGTIGHLPHAVTFFLSSDERRRVLRALRALDRKRESALLIALDVRDSADR